MDASRDWGGFGAIINEAQALDDAERTRPLLACPKCRHALDTNVLGEKSCPLGHFQAGPGALRGDYS